MTSPLQKAPMSLLAALELKVSGDNPNEFGGQVQPGIDVWDNYLLDRVLVAGNTTAAVAPAVAASGTVAMPAEQRWRVRSLSATLNVAAGDAAIDKQLRIGIQSPDGFICNVRECESSLSFENLVCSIYFDRPLWLPPGWVLQASGALATAPASNWSVIIRSAYEKILE